jgi:ubiquinone/menaquinone biosynthesis C-methylase UbiE
LTNPDTMTTLVSFSKDYSQILKGKNRDIFEFPLGQENIDHTTVDSFGEEWKAFHGFDEAELMKLGDEYFDIVTEEMINKDTTLLEVGCGSGRFLKYLSSKAGRLVGVDPSEAIFAADELLGKNEKIMLVRASANDLPFKDESFDFVCSIGVLHHIPNTFKALQACVDKVKKGGYFYTYLYYDLDNRGFVFRSLYKMSNAIRLGICKLPPRPKRFVCDLLAVGIYMPFILTSRLFRLAGIPVKYRRKIPLFGYENRSFYIIRNDSLDRFGTPLEQRFTKNQIQEMLEKAGLSEIVFSNNIPFWHVVGKKN